MAWRVLTTEDQNTDDAGGKNQHQHQHQTTIEAEVQSMKRSYAEVLSSSSDEQHDILQQLLLISSSLVELIDRLRSRKADARDLEVILFHVRKQLMESALRKRFSATGIVAHDLMEMALKNLDLMNSLNLQDSSMLQILCEINLQRNDAWMAKQILNCHEDRLSTLQRRHLISAIGRLSYDHSTADHLTFSREASLSKPIPIILCPVKSFLALCSMLSNYFGSCQQPILENSIRNMAFHACNNKESGLNKFPPTDDSTSQDTSSMREVRSARRNQFHGSVPSDVEHMFVEVSKHASAVKDIFESWLPNREQTLKIVMAELGDASQLSPSNSEGVSIPCSTVFSESPSLSKMDSARTDIGLDMVSNHLSSMLTNIMVSPLQRLSGLQFCITTIQTISQLELAFQCQVASETGETRGGNSAELPRIQLHSFVGCVLCCWDFISHSLFDMQQIPLSPSERVLMAECALDYLMNSGCGSYCSRVAYEALLFSLNFDEEQATRFSITLRVRKAWVESNYLTSRVALLGPGDGALILLAEVEHKLQALMQSGINLRLPHLSASWDIIDSTSIHLQLQLLAQLSSSNAPSDQQHSLQSLMLAIELMLRATAEEEADESDYFSQYAVLASISRFETPRAEWIASCICVLQCIGIMCRDLADPIRSSFDKFVIHLVMIIVDRILSFQQRSSPFSADEVVPLAEELVTSCCVLLDSESALACPIEIFDCLQNLLQLIALPARTLLLPLLRKCMLQTLTVPSSEETSLWHILRHLCCEPVLSDTPLSSQAALCAMEGCYYRLCNCATSAHDHRREVCTMFIWLMDRLGDLPVEDAVALYTFAHGMMIRSHSYCMQDADDIVARLLSLALLNRELKPSTLKAALVLFGELYYIQYRLPMISVDSWTLPPKLNIGDIADVQVASELYAYCCQCKNVASFISKQDIRDSFLCLSSLPCVKHRNDKTILTHSRLSAYCCSIASYDNDQQFLEASNTFKLISFEDNPFESSLPLANLFSDILELGLRVPGTVFENEEFTQLCSDHSYVKMMAADEITDLTAYLTATFALEQLLRDPVSFQSWFVLLTQAIAAVQALSDNLHSKALYLETAQFIEDMQSACLPGTSSSQLVESSGEAFCWPLQPCFLKQDVLPRVEFLYSCMSKQHSEALERWYKASYAEETFLQQLCSSHANGKQSKQLLSKMASFADCGEYVKGILLLYQLKKLLSNLVLRIVPFMHCLKQQQGIEECRWQRTISTFAVFLQASAKELAVASKEKERLRYFSLKIYQMDNYWSSDAFAMIMAAKLMRKLFVCSAEAMRLCNMALEAAEQRSSGLSKSEKVAVLYYANSLRLKVALDLLSPSSMSPTCCLVLSNDKSFVQWTADHQMPSEERKVHLWRVIAAAVNGLEACRKREPYHHKSIHRLAALIIHLKEHSMLPPDSILPAQNSNTNTTKSDHGVADIFSRPGLFDFSQITYEHSLVLLRRLFDKKRPQIIAMWFMENPITPWDQIAASLTDFDHLRRKYTLCYTKLLTLCNEEGAAIFVSQQALDCKHSNATVCFIVANFVRVFLRLAENNCTLNDPSQSKFAERMERITQLYHKLTRMKLPSVLADVETSMRSILSSTCYPLPESIDDPTESSHCKGWLLKFISFKEVLLAWVRLTADLKATSPLLGNHCGDNNKQNCKRRAAETVTPAQKVARSAEQEHPTDTTWL